jgi:hypothetical protein
MDNKNTLIVCECGHSYRPAYKKRHDKRDVHIIFMERKQKIQAEELLERQRQEAKRIAEEQKKKQDKKIIHRPCLDCKKGRVFSTQYCLYHINYHNITVDIKYKCVHCKFCFIRSGFYRHCRTCFYYRFPEHELSIKQINYCGKERAVKNFIAQNGLLDDDYRGFIHNMAMLIPDCNDCTVRRRIDFRKLINGTLLCIEVDEHAHGGYNKVDEEIIRYNELMFAYTCRMVFIRFNPDPCRGQKSKLQDRLPILLEEIKRHTARILNDENTELLEIHYMFYPIKKQQ